MAVTTTPRIITRTINGTRILTALQRGKPYTHVPYTTLNELHGIQVGVMPDNAETPRVQYFCIGTNGHVNKTGEDGGHFTSARKHGPDDFGLYTQIPFLLRRPGDDLTPDQRLNYALRKIIEINGENWIAYYLMKIPTDSEPVRMLLNTVKDGVTTTVPFIPKASNLQPQPKEPPANGAITTDGSYLSVTSMTDIVLGPQGVEEQINVAEIIHGNPERALISEIGLVAASPKIVSYTDPGGGNVTMEEAVMAQITTHITGLWPVAFATEGFRFGLDLGGTEPLIGLNLNTNP